MISFCKCKTISWIFSVVEITHVISRHGPLYWFRCFLRLLTGLFMWLIISFSPLYNFSIKKMSYRTFWCIISLQTKKYERKWSCTTNLLYNEKTIIGRLYHYFYIYFEACSIPTAETLVMLLLSILTLESADSIRFLYRHFLSKLTDKSLNAFYYACSYAKVDYSRFMNATASMALKLRNC